MLSLEIPALEIAGVLVYHDHANPTHFYYAAPNPKIARTNGRTLFDLFMYTVELEHSPLAGTRVPDELGAGFLTLGVDCALGVTQRSQIVRELATQLARPEEQISLAPIPYHKGTVRVLALDQFTAPSEPSAPVDSDQRLQGRPTFVEAIVGSAKPSLLGDLRTIFSLKLSQEGVVFLEGLYKDQAAPVGVVFEVSYYGLRPAVEARITANLERIYKYFGGGLQGQYAWFRADISAGLRFLEERGDVQIELTSQATGEEAQKSKDLALSLFRDRIVQELFRPTVPTPQNLGGSGIENRLNNLNNASHQGIGLTLRADLGQELKTVIYDFRERAPEERTHAPQAFLPLLLSPNEVEARTHRIDLHHDFFELLEVLVTGPSVEEFNTLGIREVKVDLTYGDSGDPVPPEHGTLLFRPDATGDKLFAVKRRSRSTLAYNYALTYEFLSRADTDADAFRYELPVRTATSRTLHINPNVDFGLLTVEVEPGQIHADIQTVDVDLTYQPSGTPFVAQDHVRLHLANPEPHTWQVRTLAAAIQPYTAIYTFRFQDNTVYRATAQQFTDRLLTVDAPFHHERRLLVRPNVVSSTITHLDLEIDYADELNAYQRHLLLALQAPFTSQEIKWPILDINQQAIQYRVTAYEPGFTTEGEWQTTGDPSIIIGSVGSRVATVKAQLVGPPLPNVGIDAVLLKLQPLMADATEAETQSVLFDGSQSSQECKLIVPPGQSLLYRFQTTTFKSSGEVVEAPWRESSNTLLVIATRTL